MISLYINSTDARFHNDFPIRELNKHNIMYHHTTGLALQIKDRQPKETNFVCEDWLTRWFVDIGRWARLCSSHFEGVVDDATIASEAEYMAWYADIARTRVHKPKLVVTIGNLSKYYFIF